MPGRPSSSLAASQGGRPLRILIAGATGFGNLGDDAIRNRMVEFLKEKHGAEIYVGRPRPQKDMVEWCDGIILGGGGIIYDGAGKPAGQRNFEYFFSMFLSWAVEMGKPASIIACGVQALGEKANINELTRLCKHVGQFTVRHQQDKERLDALGIHPDVRVGDDLAFTSKASRYQFTLPSSRKKIALIPQAALVQKVGIESMQWLVDTLKELDYDVYLACTSYEDLDVIRALASRVYEHGSVRDFIYLTEGEVTSLLGEMDMVLSSRFHGLVLAQCGGTPQIFGLSSGYKLKNQLHPDMIAFHAVKDRNRKALAAVLKNSHPLITHGSPQVHLDALDAFVRDVRNARGEG